MKIKSKSQIWVTDTEGNEYVCKKADVLKDKGGFESLSAEDKTTCQVINKYSGKHSLENLNNLKFGKW